MRQRGLEMDTAADACDSADAGQTTSKQKQKPIVPAALQVETTSKLSLERKKHQQRRVPPSQCPVDLAVVRTRKKEK